MIIPADHVMQYPTPENLHKFVNEIKALLSESHQPQPSTSKQPAPQIKPSSPDEVSPRVNPPQEIPSPKSPVRQTERSPIMVVWLVVFNVPSTARSFGDGTPIYCPLRRT